MKLVGAIAAMEVMDAVLAKQLRGVDLEKDADPRGHAAFKRAMGAGGEESFSVAARSLSDAVLNRKSKNQEHGGDDMNLISTRQLMLKRELSSLGGNGK